MKISDNTVLILGIIGNVVKDIGVLAIFGWLSYHFNNIWIMLFALLFSGGINIKFNEKESNKDE